MCVFYSKAFILIVLISVLVYINTPYRTCRLVHYWLLLQYTHEKLQCPENQMLSTEIKYISNLHVRETNAIIAAQITLWCPSQFL